ncbi:MAG: DUF3656 domain-containing protein [Chloroflexota bacterium]
MPTTLNPSIKPEIMSPAGYWPQLQAAIEAGADAVYFGLNHFTARAKVGFTLAELPAVMRTLHQRGVKGYVAFNTLVFDHEVKEAAAALAAIAEAGADSIIVQDVGIAQLAHQIAPELDIHGSTQMSITNVEGIALAQQFGVSRVVLARELSLPEIRAIREQTDCELEIFVHGALCVSYSGQCFSSEAWGGRSANRGQCAQACRLPYELRVDNQLKPLGDARYLLSPGDLFALHQIPEIAQMGISALKIEGRYKDAHYVALTTQAYRKAVDDVWTGSEAVADSATETALTQAYSRGLGPHFIAGTDHQTVVQGRSPRHRGLYIGRVVEVKGEQVIIRLSEPQQTLPLRAGDGVVFDAADWRSPEKSEEGGRLYQVTPRKGGLVALSFANGAIDFGRIRSGDWLWRTHSPELDKIAKPFIQPENPVHKQPIQIDLSAHQDQPLEMTWFLVKNPTIRVRVQSAEPLPAARNQGLTIAFAQKQLRRLGNTVYHLDHLTVDIQGNPFVPSSLLNQLRRDAVSQLVEMQGRTEPIQIHDPQKVIENSWPVVQPTTAKTADSSPQLHLLIRTPAQLDAAIERRPASITLDYLDFFGLRPAVDQIRKSGILVRVASPRILKPGEQGIVRFLRRLNCQVLVRSAGLLQALQGENEAELIGDFSLNAANAYTASTLLELGLHRLTPTHDLNAAQVTALTQHIDPEDLEVVVYQHLPVFYTEHCVFCRFLSTGTNKKNCGQPCERHEVALQDKKGRAHPVLADVGCRNTVFGAEAQHASAHLDAWRTAGISHFRLEFTHETADDVTNITQAFQQTFTGQMNSTQLANRLKQIAPEGTTEGSLYIPDGYLNLPLL